MVHRLLRGRYLLTAALAGIFAVAGGAAGFLLQKPLYKSDGLIRIVPTLPRILFETEQTSSRGMFSSFVSEQAELLQQSRVISLAMESDRWRETLGTEEITTVEGFRSMLRVRNDRKSQGLIFVYCEHPSVGVAQAGTQAVMEAYMEIHGNQSTLDQPEVRGVLETRQADLQGELRAITGQIQLIADRWGTDDLQPIMREAFANANALVDERSLLELQVEELQRLSERTEDDSPAAQALTEERAASMDSTIADLLRLRSALDQEKTVLLASGIRERHRDMVRVNAGLADVQRQIDARLEELRSAVESGQSTSTGAPTIDDLNFRIERLNQRIDEAERRRAELGRDIMQMRDYRNQREQLDSDIAIVKRRIDEIDTESKVETFEGAGRITIANEATRPPNPTNDKRIKFAGAGFVGAGAVPVLAMMGLGLLSRRVQYSDDEILEGAHSKIVGVLPDLGKSAGDRELADASAFAVHQIRSQLQVLYHRDDTSIFAITSPAPGDGKTSLAIALALSFAESGNRTLLIDLDMIGRGLSQHFGHAAAPSLADAIADGADLDPMIQSTRFDQLSVLPAGMGDEHRISRLSPTVVRRLVASFRGRYDTVLIDSGPILGSIEAGLLSSSVDGVVMVVGRGQLRPLIKRAVEHITSVGGHVAATVFNRASMYDLKHSSSSMSVHFSRQASRQAAEQARAGGSQVGPLGGALFSSRAESGDDKHTGTAT